MTLFSYATHKRVKSHKPKSTVHKKISVNAVKSENFCEKREEKNVAHDTSDLLVNWTN